jgi:hypothetical protein
MQMLQELEISPQQVTGDGGYDKRKFYQACQEQQIANIIILPQHNAKIWQHGNCQSPPHPCDENLRYIRHHGRQKWKREHDYHQRSLAETAMFRFKTTFGAHLQSQSLESQVIETQLKCDILNRFTME